MENKTLSYYIVPLYNVDPTDMDPRILPDGYKLISNREFFAKYRPYLVNHHSDLEADIQITWEGQIVKRVTATYLLMKELQVQSLFEGKKFNPDINDELYKREQETIIEWIFALRLLCSGNIQVYQSYSLSKDFYASYSLSIGTIIDNLDNVWNFSKEEICSLDNYLLGQVKSDDLSAMLFKCKNNYLSMKIPLNYWISYYQERDLINRIIKLAIIWEATLLNDKKNELQYTLKMRGSCVLQKDIRKVFDLAYNVRSQLLHTGLVEQKTINRINEYLGKYYKNTWTTLFYFIKDVLEPMTRNILVHFLDSINENHLTLEQTAISIDDKICSLLSLNKE